MMKSKTCKQIILGMVAVMALDLVAETSAADYIKAPVVVGNDITPPTPKWIEKIEALAPKEATAKPAAPRKILVFSISTGFQHKVTPHAAAAVKAMGEKSGAYEVVQSDDIEMFMPEKLRAFDAVLLNNTCSNNPGRNLLLDVLNNASTVDKSLGLKYSDLSPEERKAHADELEQSLLSFVRSGKGLIVLHGGIVFLNNSPQFSEMLGGSFNSHPPRQMVTLDLVEPHHPLLAGFDGKGFIHNDEPYLFKNAYTKKNFRPLLKMDISKLDENTPNNPLVTKDVCYTAWIKKYGKGRVFYCSPSHQPESYETAAMLRFVQDGIQYALGDLECDDTRISAEDLEPK